MDKKLQLACYKVVNKGKSSEYLDFYYGWSKIENITDLWTFVGWLVNEIDIKISFHYLEYYNTYNDDFNEWLSAVKENDYVVGRFKCGTNEFIIKLVEEGNI